MNTSPSKSASPLHSTMLSIVHPQPTQELHFTHYHTEHQPTSQHYTYSRPTAMPHRVREPELVRASSATSTTSSSSISRSPCVCDVSVVQALEIARESPDGAQDMTVCKILDAAISAIWGKVEAAPDSYVMTRNEFSVFNYFQDRFLKNPTARMARARYWDHASA